jgi:hypothetical protein
MTILLSNLEVQSAGEQGAHFGDLTVQQMTRFEKWLTGVQVDLDGTYVRQ